MLRAVTRSAALRMALGAAFALGLACAGPAHERRVATQAAPVPLDASCAEAGPLTARTDRAIADGNWLRARRAHAAERKACGGAAREMPAELARQLDAAGARPSELLGEAGKLRRAGRLAEARAAEARAVVALEREQAAELAVRARFD
jgi:hypothetical protein